jgi:glycosyltransferase involved in cell wall biosynthesis
MTRRAAHFIAIPEVFGNPQNDALMRAFLELGYCIDIYSPPPLPDPSAYGPGVRCFTVEYGKRWLLKNLASPRWLNYDFLSASAEDPFPVVDAIGRLYRRRRIFLVDEIKSGPYWGNAPSRWKELCRAAIRRADLCIVNDESRKSVLAEYAELPNADRVVVYPSCFVELPAPGDRAALRREWGIPEEALLIGISGVFNDNSGADWILNAFCSNQDLWLAVQSPQLTKLDRTLFNHVQGRDRLFLGSSIRSATWQEPWGQAAAADIGCAIYLHDGPQFQNMGIASNRLCMYLSMGVPVIASRQDSFRFLEEFDCGRMVFDAWEFAAAADEIAARLPQMRANALRCTREYIRAPERYAAMKEAISALRPGAMLPS